LEQRWEKLTTQRRVASALVLVFGAGLALVEARRLPWLSQDLIDRLPSNHFEAILLPFTLLLLAEVISLVFALAQSVAVAVGKQLEIMSLILIRQSFKELTYFPEPIVWSTTSGEITRRVLYILSDSKPTSRFRVIRTTEPVLSGPKSSSRWCFWPAFW
jgi:ABC-type multidrug transport system fused ATPase/permease subunit